MEEEGPFLGFSCMNLTKKLGEGIMLTTWVSIYYIYIYKCKNDFYLDLPCTLKNYQKHSIAREVALLIYDVLDYVSSRHFGKNFDFYIMKIF